MITHALSILLGAGIWAGLRTNPRETHATHAPEPARLGQHRGITADLIQSRLRKTAALEKEQQDYWTTTFREAGEQEIERTRRLLMEEAESFQRIKLLSQRFRHTEDLSSTLYQVLLDEDSELAAALFIEWYRRNPTEAVLQLQIREDFLDAISWNEPVHLIFSTDDLVDLLGAGRFTADVQQFLISSHVSHLADLDDLQEFTTLADSLGPWARDITIGEFAANWLPDDGDAAARFIVESMPEDLAREFLGCFNDFGAGSRTAWTADFTSALLSRDLGPLEDFRQNIITHAGNIDSPLGDGFYNRRDDESYRLIDPPPAKISRREVATAIERDLLHDRDFPELLLRGETSLPEIREAMLASNPVLEDHPDQLDSVLLEALFPFAPEQAVTWASNRLNQEDLAEALVSSLGDHSGDPRATWTASLHAAIPTHLRQKSEPLDRQMLREEKQLREWDQLLGTSPPLEEP